MELGFEENAALGPDFEGPWPAVPQGPGNSFLGLPVRSRFGLAAGLGVDSRWIGTFARLGYDILTYKTVRLHPRRAHPAPNWLFLDAAAEAAVGEDVPLGAGATLPADPAQATAAGSFGMPSAAPEAWRPDIARARAALAPGQVLVVSIVATAEAAQTPDAFVAEFSELAAMVREAGAQAVEANLSCPNVPAAEGEVYRDAALARRIARAVKRAAPDLPLLIKTGLVETDAAMTELLRALDGAADAVTMINAPARRFVDAGGAPAFGPGSARGGGSIALGCVRRAAAAIARDRLSLAVVGVGGVSTPARAAAMLEAGAAAALVASPAAWNPALAVEVKATHPWI
jgi:dihydroorotate dehydrogenase